MNIALRNSATDSQINIVTYCRKVISESVAIKKAGSIRPFERKTGLEPATLSLGS